MSDPIDKLRANYNSTLVFYLNGEKVEMTNPPPWMLLIDYLRENGHIGTKVMCQQGGCGACTVMVSSYSHSSQLVTRRAINACLCPICALDGMEVTTIKALGSVKTAIDPIQHELATHDGTQCGYCTPGFAMNMYTLLQNNEFPDQQTIEDRFDGNICRCTGYRSILYSMRRFAADPPPDDQLVCDPPPQDVVTVKPYTKHVFPPDLKKYPVYSLFFEYQDDTFWYRPLTLPDVYTLKGSYVKQGRPVQVVVGNTSMGVYFNPPQIYIDVAAVPELVAFAQVSGGISIGGAVTLTRLIDALDQIISSQSPDQVKGYVVLRDMVEHIGSVMVRNAGSLAGNLMLVLLNASETSGGDPFPSDLYVTLLGLGAQVTIGSASGNETYPLNQIPEVELWPDDAVILSVFVPESTAADWYDAYRVARREQNAHAIVNAGFSVTLDASLRVKSSRIALGGLERMPVRLNQVENVLTGTVWNEDTLKNTLGVLKSVVAAMTLYPSSEGIDDSYRRELAETLYYKFFVSVALEVDPGEVHPENRLAGEPYVRPLSTGQQTYKIYKEEEPISDPIMKFSAYLQTTGEATYVRDLPSPPGCLYGRIVTSNKAHATFTYKGGLDAMIKALKDKHDGFIDYVTVRDIPEGGTNLIGLGGDDPIFADGLVTSVGQRIGLVVATYPTLALQIAVEIQMGYLQYTDQQPLLLTIPEAIKAGSIFPDQPNLTHIHHIIRKGSVQSWLDNPTQPLQEGDLVISGTQETGFQAHFYMELQNCLVVPGEGKDYTIYCSTQDAGSVQSDVSAVLNFPANDISVRLKRIGGGFGGKESRPPIVVCPVAVAAVKLHQPVRLVLDHFADMKIIGKRHAALGEYWLSMTKTGKINGWKTAFYSNGGDTYDVSFPVMDLILLTADNAYNVSTCKFDGEVCKTNIASNTALRSFGVVQGITIIEEAIERAASLIGVRPETLRKQNFYSPGLTPPYDTTPYGAELKDCLIADVWDKLWESSDFEAREAAVQTFNSQNKWRKRGISMIPLKYGISYTDKLLNQGGALINVYSSDGSVLVQHGGVEMGQGLQTKMAQLAAYTINVPIEKIEVGDRLTNVVPNASSTGASTGSDLNGGAVDAAATALRKRLEDFCQALKVEHGEQWCADQGINYWDYDNGWQAVVQTHGESRLMWDNVVSQAYINRISLASQAFFSYPGLEEVSETHPYGHPFFYYNYAAACSEVEIDVLTGDFSILRTDILYDAGKSLNPCVDIGQIEGAFVMGVGYLTTEEWLFDQQGFPITGDTWTYKPPCSKTIPVDFRVSLVNSPRTAAFDHSYEIDTSGIKSSKTTGEPPLVLANTVFFAIKHAIWSARQDRGSNWWFELPAPATAQRIQQACQVLDITMTL